MSKSPNKNGYQRKPEAEPTVANVPKERRCLMCHAEFESAWAGERICGRCRSKSAWREGHGCTSGGRAV